MKKSFTFLKVSCVAALLSIMGISEGLAQGLRTSYFMDNVPARLKMNPALQPARGYFNIPAIGAIGLSASSNKLSIDDFIDIIENENDFLNSDKFISRLDNKNTMNIDLTVDIISFGFYSGKGFWTVNLGAAPSLVPPSQRVCSNLPVTLILIRIHSKNLTHNTTFGIWNSTQIFSLK